MNDLIFCIDFKKNNKTIWSLNCDSDSFNVIERLVSVYLASSVYHGKYKK